MGRCFHHNPWALFYRTSLCMQRDHAEPWLIPKWPQRLRSPLPAPPPAHTTTPGAGCPSPALAHCTWKPGEAWCKSQMVETSHTAAFQWLKGMEGKASFCWAAEQYIHKLYAQEGTNTALRAQKRQNSSKQDSEQRSADRSRTIGITAAGAAISALL